MKYWATNPYLTIDTNVLARIQEFSMSICSSPLMTELATELHLIVTKRVWLALVLLSTFHIVSLHLIVAQALIACSTTIASRRTKTTYSTRPRYCFNNARRAKIYLHYAG